MTSLQTGEPPAPGDGPASVRFPLGTFSFELHGIGSGAAVALTLTVNSPMPVDKYYLYGPTPDNTTPHWYDFSFDWQTGTGAVVEGNQITLYFVDGLRGDHDLTANGVTSTREPLSLPACRRL